jgi:class 3 adenylate cyclase
MVETTDQSFATCTVFAEIVDYAKKPVAEQIKLTERFNALLDQALTKIVPEDRIILETGSGAAVSCLGKTEDALLMAIDLRDRIAAQTAADGPPLSLHFGINLGPAKLVTEEGSEPNIVGDGLNVAQTVMSFAQPGQILVSRSYHDAVSAVAPSYARMLKAEGSRTDKYLREHHVYSVTDTAGAATAAAISPEERKKRLRIGALAAIAAILVLAIGIRVSRNKPAPPPEPAPSPVAEQAPASTATPAAAPAPPGATAAPGNAAPAAETPPAPDTKAAPKKKVVKPKTDVAAAPVPAAAAAPAPAAPAPGSLEFAITPWGEVYVDGAKRGVSPPMTQIPIAPGKHSIEIRNTSFPSYNTTVEVSSGAQSKIKYKFN